MSFTERTNEGIKNVLWPYGQTYTTGTEQAGPFAGFIVINASGATVSYTDGAGVAHTAKYFPAGYYPFHVTAITAPTNDVVLANYKP